MNPIRHPSNTRTLGAPEGWDQNGLPVEPLGITDQVIEGVPCVLSFWQPDADELYAIAAGGHVVLSIVGRTMPPALLTVTQVPEPIAPEPATGPASAVIDLLEERKRQDQQWGGPDHDDEHSTSDWLRFIDRQTNRARFESDAVRRERLVKIAALAVADVETIDRRTARSTGSPT